ncbi:MAG: hypothetical protein KC656_09915 [Myxococcales bacterium]|nr:hypothetical protein [Myxococcales bacterium]MCB9670857.1 hypothetical protein [Alphaproteobacteria bacterium]MCB9691090.1 hypothetical protein [Alphaproteobacteria bacterium]
MKKMFLALALVAAGCDGGDPCTTEGETRCTDSNVQECVDGKWTVTIDCVAAGQECMQDETMMEGEAHCMAGMEM